ncbi:MAG: hypothetical protein CMC14_04415 [Flavobacteriaceae bacterium]|nr:hypothetical protein [Flavobacteriaceae bacterium]|tara:strand:+ start:1360 stop:2262 length:903 start_codon:yes stop_codon:yes gene_type:complete
MSIKQPILITGSNRSGSTWVGQVLEAHGKVDVIIEPLNLNRIKRYGIINYDFWYPKVHTKSIEKEKLSILLNYYLTINYRTAFKQFFSSYEGHNTYQSLKKRLRRASKPIKLLKDPTALFSIPWLVNTFQIKPIILIRHPAAYVLSIKEKNWWFDFDHFLKQPDFFIGNLEPFKGEVIAFKKEEDSRSIVDNAALLWKIFYAQVKEYQEKYPEWFYISHEELSINPLQHFKSMCQYLDLEFNESIKKYITASTQAKSNEEFKRDSKKNSEKWKYRLSQDEKESIYAITASISNHFYKKWI